jgi:hypothetical protein
MASTNHFPLTLVVSLTLVLAAACGDDGRPRTDTGFPDSGMGDTGAGDSAPSDTGASDSAPSDTGAPDATMDGGGDAMMGDAAMDAMVDGAMDAMMDAPIPACIDMDLASAIGDAVASGDLTGEGDDAMGSCGDPLGEDIAYTWTAPSTAMWTFDTFGSAADTVLHVHTGAACSGAELGCDDDTGGFQSRVDVMLTSGTLVTVVVDAYDDDASDTFVLNITETSTIAADEVGACDDGLDNDRDGEVDCLDFDCETDLGCYELGTDCAGGVDDDGDGDIDCADFDCFGYAACIETMCANTLDDDGDGDIDCADADCLTTAACETCPAVNLGMTLGASTGTTTGETNNRAGSCGGSTSEDRTVAFTAPAAGTYTIDTFGSAFDTVLYVLEGGCAGFEIACDDDSDGGSQSEVVVDLGAGQTIIIVVDGFGGGDGAYTLNISNAAMSFGAPTTAGDLVITEIMQNPGAPVDDIDGEWFEVVNTTTSTLNLNGCTVSDLDLNSFTIGTDVLVRPGEYAVLARGPNPGFTPTYEWSGTTALANGDDEILIECGTTPTEIDRVEYDGGPMFPDPDGASMSLSDSATDAVMNDVGSNWCEALPWTTPYDAVNRGTPGFANPDC